MPTVQALDCRAQHLLDASRLFAKIQPELSSHLSHQLEEYIEHRSELGKPRQLQQQRQQHHKRRNDLGPELCPACSSLQIPGLTCDIAIQTETFKPPCKAGSETQARSSKTANPTDTQGSEVRVVDKAPLRRRPFGPRIKTLKTTCRVCRRYVAQPLHKVEHEKKTAAKQTISSQVVAAAAVASSALRVPNAEHIATASQDKTARLNAVTANTTATITPSTASVSGASACALRKARQRQKKGGLAAILAQSKVQSDKGKPTSSSLGLADFARKT